MQWEVAGPVGAGLPAKQATRYMAPASPVFAGKPAPTGNVQHSCSRGLKTTHEQNFTHATRRPLLTTGGGRGVY
ncbi:hypothetical protein CR512_00820 [Pseudomonas putida]|nr:hypothetical protein CR512_00820 [Pseudomonas putida]